MKKHREHGRTRRVQVVERAGEALRHLRRRAQAEERQTLSGLGADTGQPAELGGQPLHRLRDERHAPSSLITAAAPVRAVREEDPSPL